MDKTMAGFLNSNVVNYYPRRLSEISISNKVFADYSRSYDNANSELTGINIAQKSVSSTERIVT